MENFDEFIKERLLSLPPEIQKAFSETDIIGEIEKIRSKHGLMYDQSAVLESETMLVFLGLEKPGDLIKNIESNANVSKETATEIVDEIEKNILKQIKSKLVEVIEKEDAENPESKNQNVVIKENKDETLDREAILKEIEDPTPTFGVKKTEDLNIKKDNLPEIAPISAIQKYVAPIPQTKNIIEKKLSEPTHIAPKKVEISLKKIPQASNLSVSQTQKPAFDPYKEPIE